MDNNLSVGQLNDTETSPAFNPHDSLDSLWAGKAMLREKIKELFEKLSIEGAPIPAEQLQRMMADSGLEQNELSRGIIEAREE
ncbi:MAG: hypothetical protein IT210_08600 [Armatimonadetes bacterium]|nr:hypothetical protein [Armatimonadota bacterium]